MKTNRFEKLLNTFSCVFDMMSCSVNFKIQVSWKLFFSYFENMKKITFILPNWKIYWEKGKDKLVDN